MIALAKGLHIGAMLIWCAGLLALPIVLELHRHHKGSATRFAEFRLISHYGYIGIATPAAVIAIAAGTWVMIIEGVTDPWFLAKLAFVAGMVLLHAWFGHLIQMSGEKGDRFGLPSLLLPGVVALVLIGAVLWLVLAKPDLNWIKDYLPLVWLEPLSESP